MKPPMHSVDVRKSPSMYQLDECHYDAVYRQAVFLNAMGGADITLIDAHLELISLSMRINLYSYSRPKSLITSATRIPRFKPRTVKEACKNEYSRPISLIPTC